jgi:hypothetical protein
MPKIPESSPLEEARREADRQLGSATGMGQERFRQIDSTVGQGMREGLVEFDTRTASPGSYGTLRFIVEERGRRVVRERPISSDVEAAALIGLQEEARKRRHSR